MLLFKLKTHMTLVLALGMLTVGFSSAATAQEGEFEGTSYTCLQFTNGQGENATGKALADLARFWILGYLTGHYYGQEKLDLADDSDTERRVIRSMLSKCREFPSNSVLAVADNLARDRKRSLPKTTSNDFNPQEYSCGDYVDGQKGSASDVLKADLADFWAFAFIQGFVNSDDADVVIPVENKSAIVNAINKNCASNRSFSYYQLTSAVAPMVKPQ